MERQRYYRAQDKKGAACTLVELAELALEFGYQVECFFRFPGTLGGNIEYITIHALRAATNAGIDNVTVRGRAKEHTTRGNGANGVRIKALE